MRPHSASPRLRKRAMSDQRLPRRGPAARLSARHIPWRPWLPTPHLPRARVPLPMPHPAIGPTAMRPNTRAPTCGWRGSTARSGYGCCCCRAGGRWGSPKSRSIAPIRAPGCWCCLRSVHSSCARPAAPTTITSTATTTPRSRAQRAAPFPRARSRRPKRWPSPPSARSPDCWFWSSSTPSRSGSAPLRCSSSPSTPS